MKSLFRSKNRCNSPSYAHSSRSSSLTSTGDSGIDDDINQTGSSSSTMSNYSNQVNGGPRNFFTPPNVSVNNGTSAVRSNFHVEHLASFPLSAGDKMVSAKERLQKAKELITKGEPWTKEMELSITEKEIILRDFQTQELIERYPSSHVDSVQEVNDDPMLKSVLVFSTVQTAEKYAAVHLFQCDKVPAHVIAPEINKMIAKNPRVISRSNSQTKGVSVLPPPPSAPAPSPPKADIGARKTETPVVGPNHTATKTIQGESYDGNMSLNLMGAQINREVHILNHCIDDIEELVYRVKQVAEAWKQLEIKYKSKKSKSRKQEAEAIESRSPPREEFIDAFQKCKYSFILLGKLREHLKNPSSAELLHHLMNPLSLLIRCTRGPEEASKVISPLMTSESIELLRSTLNDKEAELWQSLGPAWTLPKSSPQWNNRSIAPYEPKFRSGWVPPEIIGSGRSMPANVGATVAASAAERGEKLKNNANKEVTVTGKKSTFKKATAVFSFTGSNSKELSVVKGDELLILDDSRQWWCVRNSKGGVGFVPYTVFTPSGSLNRNEVKTPSGAEKTNSSNGVSNDTSTFENMIQNRATKLKKSKTLRMESLEINDCLMLIC
ncbi:epidermal growth factor receptor kinase substrate 8-like isoform X2 [Xenia sp. Carnegie-2017]|uniref:epidermal growth factor receptor kinase substrate 8-like isoform X2 n=1 Tax=Xenia sp. Carnegie-2017 TaxID=2897299 RepID=UPI001F03E555|nr:epidermal growth factor receptor kinase substrate 8-like isoform X2 [Xenia sp. Carnegie-2017]